MQNLEEKIKKVKYILFDLDGTLLSRGNEISQYSADVLNELQERGYKVAFSTGRSLCALGGITKAVGLRTNAPSIGCAGGEISQVLFDEVDRWEYSPFPLDDLKDLLTFALRNDLHFSLDGVGWRRYYSEGLHYLPKYERDRDKAYSCKMRFPELTPIFGPGDVEKALDGTVVKPMIWYREKSQLECMKTWNETHPGYSNFSSGYSLIEVLPKTINKANALVHLCELTGIDVSNCCVFGDSENDLPIMAKAGLSVGMISGYQEVKEKADIITERDNDNSGAAHMASKLFLE